VWVDVGRDDLRARHRRASGGRVLDLGLGVASPARLPELRRAVDSVDRAGLRLARLHRGRGELEPGAGQRPDPRSVLDQQGRLRSRLLRLQRSDRLRLKYEREPRWFPLIGRSLRDGPALPPVYGWD